MFEESAFQFLRVRRTSHFASDSLGTASLPRQDLIDEIMGQIKEIDSSDEPTPNSVYVYGMRGSGKSVLLGNLAKLLQTEG